MTSWKRVITQMVDKAEDHFDALKYRLHYALGGPGPIKIVTYRGFGTQKILYLKGRVLEDKGETLGTENDTLWDNLVNMYKRMESNEVPHARLAVHFQGRTEEVIADEEGHFDVWVESEQPLPADRSWHQIEVELLEPQSDDQKGPVKTTGEVLVPPQSARFAVISDVDDTVLETDATHLIRMARNAFLGNAHTRLPFAGVAALYRALYKGNQGNERNPLFYVSSSPWNLYDLLVEFFRLQDFPTGPVLFLRNWGISEDEILPVRHHKHKIASIQQFIDAYDHLPFILIGDSGQEDPEIYTRIVEQYPERILAVYIRNVSRNLVRPEAIRELAKKVVAAGSTLILADDSLAMAEHAAEQGWIDPASLPSIQLEKVKDEAPPNLVEFLLEDDSDETPTVVVKEEAPEKPQSSVEEGAIEAALEEGDKDEEAPPTVIVEPEEDQKPKL
jgi:phosphatidate phosphatase APP1